MGFFFFFCFVCLYQIASARPKQKDPKDQSCVKRGLQVTMITYGSFPELLVMPEFSDTDDACLKIIGPSVSLQIPGGKTKCSKHGLMWSADPVTSGLVASYPS